MDYMLNPMICINLEQPAGPRLRARYFLRGMGPFLRRYFYAPEYSRSENLARVNTQLAAGMGAVIALFFVAAARYISQPSARRSRILYSAFL